MIVRTSGSLSTKGVVAADDGVLTYAEAVGGTLTLFDGTSTGGDLVATVSSSGRAEFSHGLKYTALFADITAGAFVLHGTNVAKTT